jgi:hypothetical protein
MRPWDYENELALVVTKEEEEDYKKEVEKEKKRAEEVKKEYMAERKRWEELQKLKTKRLKSKSKDKSKEELALEKVFHDHPRPDTMEYLRNGMEVDKQFFADDRGGWNKAWGSKSTRCSDFRDKSKQNMRLHLFDLSICLSRNSAHHQHRT